MKVTVYSVTKTPFVTAIIKSKILVDRTHDSMLCFDAMLFIFLQWSQKSQALHGKGLGQVLKWLQQIKSDGTRLAGHETGPLYHICFQNLLFFIFSIS